MLVLLGSGAQWITDFLYLFDMYPSIRMFITAVFSHIHVQAVSPPQLIQPVGRGLQLMTSSQFQATVPAGRGFTPVTATLPSVPIPQQSHSEFYRVNEGG